MLGRLHNRSKRLMGASILEYVSKEISPRVCIYETEMSVEQKKAAPNSGQLYKSLINESLNFLLICKTSVISIIVASAWYQFKYFLLSKVYIAIED